MAILPLVGLFDGDFVLQLFVVEDTDSMDQVAQKLAEHAVNRRVAPCDASMRVVHNGKTLDANTTVSEAGIGPMDYVEVVWAN